MDNNENRLAYDYLKGNGVDFKHLAYWDPAQHQEVWNSLQSWDPSKTLNVFPILQFVEIDTDFNITGRLFVGLDEIKKSNIIELSKL